MKKNLLLSSFACILLTGCGGHKENSSDKTYDQGQIKAESDKANAFFDRVFDREVDRDPVKAALLGIKTHYDQWTDLSEAHVQKESSERNGDL
jgi:hypothetical protein